MNTNPTNRQAVEDLTPGQHISDSTGVHELVHRLPYRNGDGSPMHALTLRPLGMGDPWVARYAQGDTVHVATDAELREYTQAGRRNALGEALHRLAEDIMSLRPPIPCYSLHIGGVVESRAELERWAEHLGAEVKMGGTDDDIPVVRVDVAVAGGPSLSIGLQSAAEPKPKPAEPEPATDAAEPEHWHVGGSAGGPGENSAECACGVAYAGFDTHREATELLDKHIAQPEEPEQDWYFTFGSGQQHDGRYVVIAGTHDSARARMLRYFGNRWCDQYPSAERAGVYEFGMALPPEDEWPEPPATDELIAAVDKAFLPTRDEQVQDGHVYACCGKTGRISRHESWCPAYKAMLAADDEQSGR